LKVQLSSNRVALGSRHHSLSAEDCLSPQESGNPRADIQCGDSMSRVWSRPVYNAKIADSRNRAGDLDPVGSTIERNPEILSTNRFGENCHHGRTSLGRELYWPSVC